MGTIEVERPLDVEHGPPEGVAPLAWKSVTAIAASCAALLAATAGRYGYTMDELYFVAAGRHLDWGYADQPPFVPLLARVMDGLFPGSLAALRMPGAFAVAAGVVIAALLAREMGGRGRAQILTAAAFAIAFLNTGGQLSTGTYNVLLWTVCAWLVARWARTHREGATGWRADLPLLWAGVATAVALQVKFLIPNFWAALAISVFFAGPREMLRRPALWIGAAIAAVSLVPGLIWQAANGWPQAGMVPVLAEETALMWGGRLAYFPRVLLTTGLIAGTLLACYGLWKLFRSPRLREHRYLGWTVVLVLLSVFASDGRFTYVAGLFPILYAAGAVQLEHRKPARWGRWLLSWPVFALSGVLTVFGLPLEDPSSFKQPATRAELMDKFDTYVQFGWDEFADDVAAAYRALPDPAQATVVTRVYWQAGVLEILGPPRGLPRPYSPNRGYWYFGVPAEKPGPVLFVGWNERSLREHFTAVRRVGTVQARVGIANGTPIWLCEGRTASWAELWPRLYTLTLR